MTEQENIIRLATEVMGWTVEEYMGRTVAHVSQSVNTVCLIPLKTEREFRLFPTWNPYASIADAFMLVDRLLERNLAYEIQGPAANRPSEPTATGHIARFSEWGTPRHHSAWGKTACEAICAASLLAIEGRP